MESRKVLLTVLAVLGVVGIIGTVAVMNSGSQLSPAMSAAFELEHAEFQGFQAKYNKAYESEEEYAKRFAIFRQNLAFINQHNNSGMHTFTLGVNEFADLTNEEFRAMYTSKMPRAQREKNYVELSLDVPDSVDWRQENAVTPVKNQGQCGSCWAFSTTGAVEGAYAIKNNSLLSFSEQQLVDCSTSFGNQGCNGGLMDNAFQYLEQNALEEESAYPYTGSDGTCRVDSSKGKVKVTGYKDVPQKNEQQLKASIAAQPTSVAVDAGGFWWQFYFGGIMKSSCGTSLDHGVLAVGYGVESGTEYYIVKNSWGSGWGEKGYIRLLRTDSDNSAGECGIALSASSPSV